MSRPRWPSGLHPAATSYRGNGDGAKRLRPETTPPGHYWRHTQTELLAATPSVTVNAQGGAVSVIGPQGMGEQWAVDLVQVQTTSGPLVQCQAQVWRGLANITTVLLGLTNNGGYDSIGVAAKRITAGEQVVVIWERANPGDTAYAIVEGVRYTLGP